MRKPRTHRQRMAQMVRAFAKECGVVLPDFAGVVIEAGAGTSFTFERWTGKAQSVCDHNPGAHRVEYVRFWMEVLGGRYEVAIGQCASCGTLYYCVLGWSATERPVTSFWQQWRHWQAEHEAVSY